MKYLAITLMFAIVLSIPIYAQVAQTADAQQAIIDAKRDVETRLNTNVWLIYGCFGGPFGVAYSYFQEPKPPLSALLGKTPEYVAFYTDTYVSLSKDAQMKKAMTGCGIACGAYLGIAVMSVFAQSGY